MPRPRQFCKDGRLSAYALACGYIDNYDRGQLRTAMWREHNTYFVRSVDEVSWLVLRDATPHLREARAFFKKHSRLRKITLETPRVEHYFNLPFRY